MVFNATFNNISVTLWCSILLVEKTGENHWPAASHWQTLSHNVVSSTPHNDQHSNSQLDCDRHWLYRYFINPATIQSHHRANLCLKDLKNLFEALDQIFSSISPVFSTNKIERHNVTEILLKVALNTIIPTLTPV
jgi:hypothetical protein